MKSLYWMIFYIFLLIIFPSSVLCYCRKKYVRSRGTSRKKKYSKNIFLQRSDSRLLPKHPLPKKVVKKIIKKNVLDNKDLLDEKYDCIIIGSGISGMVTGGILSKADKKVLILEQGKKLGGLTHCFKKKKHPFCSGIHYLFNNSVTPDIDLVSENLIKQRTHRTSELIEISDKRKLIIESDNFEDLKKSLLKQFPKDCESLLIFFGIMGKTGESTKIRIHKKSEVSFFKRWFYPTKKRSTFYFNQSTSTSTESILNHCGVKDPLLRWFLKDYFPILFHHPHQTKTIQNNFSVQSYLNRYFFLPKKSVVVGPYGIGGDNFAKTIIPNIVSRKNGSEVLGGAEVTRILTTEINEHESKAIGVELSNGRKVFADNIVSSVGISNTLKLIPSLCSLETNQKKKVSSRQHNDEEPFFFVIFLGLNGTPQELDIRHGIHILQKSCDTNLTGKLLSLNPPDFEGFESCYNISIFALESLEEENCGESRRTTTSVQIVCPASRKWFEKFEGTTKHKSRGSEYEEIRQKLTSLILEKVVFPRYPKWESCVEVLEIGTHLSFDYYCKTCGNNPKKLEELLLHDDCDFDELIDPKIRNLHLVGKDTLCYRPGIGGQMYGCLRCCGKILNRDLFEDLKVSKEYKHRKT